MIILPSGASLPNNPRIGWRNVVPTASTLSATSSATGFPVSNLRNPATYQPWKANANEETTITVELASAEAVDYVALARHNFGTAGASYVVESSADGDTWTERASGSAPNDDRVLIHEFEPASAAFWRLVVSPSSAAAQIAVLYLGRITVVERRLYVGHSPITLARRRVVSTGRSESGQFLGRTRRSETLAGSIALQNLDPDWYREELDGFVEGSDIAPFFWAWRPQEFPEEVAYCWTMGDPIPVNQRANGMMRVEAEIQGIP